MALDFAAGCLGGCAGVLVGHPFDTIKVHLQTQDFRNPKYHGTLHCFKSIAAKEGMRGLYRGVSSPMGGVALVNAIVFGVYGNAQKHMENPNSIMAHFWAGTIAGAAQSLVCSPIELAKVRLQLQENNLTGPKYKGPVDVLWKIWKTSGTRGIFRGLGITAMRDIPGFSSYFVSYELMTRNRNPSNFVTLMAGGLAGTFSWLVSFPMDIIKSRLQNDGSSGPKKYSGTVDCFRQCYREEGPRFLTRGLTSTLLRAFPMNAACFFVVSYVLKFCDQTHLTIDVHKPEPLHIVGSMSTPLVLPHKTRHFDFTKYKVKNHTIKGLVFLGAFNEAVCASEIVELCNEFDEEENAVTSNQNYYRLDTGSSENIVICDGNTKPM